MPAVLSEHAMPSMTADQSPIWSASDLEPEARLPVHSARTLVGELIWEAFTTMDDQDRSIWLQCIWGGHCLCSVARDMGLSTEEVRASLHITAHHLDAISKLVLTWDLAAKECEAARQHAMTSPVGPCGQQLAALLRSVSRRRCHCGSFARPRPSLRAGGCAATA